MTIADHLGAVIAYVHRVGGFMEATDQITLRCARAALEEYWAAEAAGAPDVGTGQATESGELRQLTKDEVREYFAGHLDWRPADELEKP